MQEEKNKLNNEIQAAKEECFLGETSDPEYGRRHGQYRPASNVKINSFILKPDKLDNELCQNLARPELKYAAKILKRQYPDWTSFY